MQATHKQGSRILALALAVAMVFTMAPVTAFAAGIPKIKSIEQLDSRFTAVEGAINEYAITVAKGTEAGAINLPTSIQASVVQVDDSGVDSGDASSEIIELSAWVNKMNETLYDAQTVGTYHFYPKWKDGERYEFASGCPELKISVTVAEPVASITDGEEYLTLQAAIDAATDGQTVTLLKTIDLSSDATGYVTVDKTMTIDMNGSSLRSTAASAKDGLIRVTDGTPILTSVTNSGIVENGKGPAIVTSGNAGVTVQKNILVQTLEGAPSTPNGTDAVIQHNGLGTLTVSSVAGDSYPTEVHSKGGHGINRTYDAGPIVITGPNTKIYVEKGIHGCTINDYGSDSDITISGGAKTTSFSGNYNIAIGGATDILVEGQGTEIIGDPLNPITGIDANSVHTGTITVRDKAKISVSGTGAIYTGGSGDINIESGAELTNIATCYDNRDGESAIQSGADEPGVITIKGADTKVYSAMKSAESGVIFIENAPEDAKVLLKLEDGAKLENTYKAGATEPTPYVLYFASGNVDIDNVGSYYSAAPGTTLTGDVFPVPLIQNTTTNKEYSSLQTAIDEKTGVEKLKVLRSFSIAESGEKGYVTVDKSIDLLMNGKTISSGSKLKASEALFTLSDAAALRLTSNDSGAQVAYIITKVDATSAISLAGTSSVNSNNVSIRSTGRNSTTIKDASSGAGDWGAGSIQVSRAWVEATDSTSIAISKSDVSTSNIKLSNKAMVSAKGPIAIELKNGKVILEDSTVSCETSSADNTDGAILYRGVAPSPAAAIVTMDATSTLQNKGTTSGSSVAHVLNFIDASFTSANVKKFFSFADGATRTGAINPSPIDEFVKNVTKGEDSIYATLAEAVTAASAGDTLQLTKDNLLSAAQVIDKNLTLDLNGKTLANKDGSGAAKFGDGMLQVTGGTLTITDKTTEQKGRVGVINDAMGQADSISVILSNAGSIVVSGGEVAAEGSFKMIAIKNNGNGTVTVQDKGKVSATGSAIHNTASSTGAIIVTGGEVSSQGETIYNGSSAAVAISGGKVTTSGTDNAAAIKNKADGAITISGTATVEATMAGSNSAIVNESIGKIIVKETATVTSKHSGTAPTGGTIRLEAVPTAAQYVLEVQDTAKVTNSTTPAGDDSYAIYFTSPGVTASNVEDYYNYSTGATLGKVYPTPSAKYVSLSDKNGTLIKRYETFTAALAAAKADNILTLINADSDLGTLTADIAIPVSLTLDLNGRNLTFEGKSFVPAAGVTFTIADSTYVAGDSNKMGGIITNNGNDPTINNVNNANVVVKAGRFQHAENTTANTVVNHSTGTITLSGSKSVNNSATAFVNKGTGKMIFNGSFYYTSTFVPAIKNESSGAIEFDGEAFVNNEKTADSTALIDLGAGSLTANGKGMLATVGNIVITAAKGGKVTIGSSVKFVASGAAKNAGAITFTGVPDKAETVLSLNGGSIYLGNASGYSIYFPDSVTVDTVDDYLTIATTGVTVQGNIKPTPPEKFFVNTTSKKQYASLKKALADEKLLQNDIIQVISGKSPDLGSEGLTVPKSMTLDLNGQTVLYAAVSDGTNAALKPDDGVTLTVIDGSTAKTGKLETMLPMDAAPNASAAPAVLLNGTSNFVLQSGTISARNSAIRHSGTGSISLKGGIVKSVSDSSPLVLESTAALNISSNAEVIANSVPAVTSAGTGKITVSGTAKVSSSVAEEKSGTIYFTAVPDANAADKVLLDVQDTASVTNANAAKYAVYFDNANYNGENISDYYSIATTATIGKIYPVSTRTLSSIAITTQPTKTTYAIGESFDKAGMVVTATFSNGSTKTVTSYTYSPSGALTASDTKVTVSYTEGDVTKTADVAIKIKSADAKLTGIAVTTQPTKVSYLLDESFDKTGMVVTATYSDNSVLAVTDYTYSPSGALKVSDTKVTISYTEGDITKTADVAILVAANADEKKVNDAKALIAKLLEGYVASNDTTSDDILSAVNAAISSTGVTVAWKTPLDFKKTAATTVAAGSITGTLELSYGSATSTLAVELTIAKLSGGGSTGSGGGSNSNKSPSTFTPSSSNNTVGSTEGNKAIAESIQAATTSATLQNFTTLLLEGIQTINSEIAKTGKGAGFTVNFDTVENGVVVSRVKVDPVKLAAVMKENLPLGVHFNQNSASVTAVTNRFEKYFDNDVVAITYDQQKPLSVNAEFAAKLDLSKLNTQNLHFYSYDPTTNTYTRIPAPKYFVDKNGYTHITAPLGGSIIITDKPLTEKK